MLKFPRLATWLMPGLSIKRWIGIATTGAVFLFVGLALVLNLQPVTTFIDFLKFLAKIFPAHISGPLLVMLGFVLFYMGLRRAYTTVKVAIQHEGRDSDLLEALYRQNKLIHGPRIVAIGGGTGLSTLLRGVKKYTSNITAIVTVGDDGGSSGRLRQEHSIIPPGDIRNCIAALADEEQLITALFQYRFKTGSGLEGHSFGNLFLTAMCHITGDMFSAIKESSKVLSISGRVLPSTLENIKLAAEMEDGTVVVGESLIPEAKGKIAKLRCIPESPKTIPEVVQAIQSAELIILGPGSLYTSVLPNLLIDEIAQAISKSRAPKLYVANIMTQPGETDGYTVGDHVQAILDHCAYPNMINGVMVNNWLPEGLLEKYLSHGYQPVELDRERCNEIGVQVIEKLLVDEGEHQVVRHNPGQLARSIIQWFKREYTGKMKLPQAAVPVAGVAAADVDPAALPGAVRITDPIPAASEVPLADGDDVSASPLNAPQ
jgi:uncharacterized cofD-like protein